MWLRWSWRDLRHHGTAVAAIALVMAIGVGVFAGLGSTATWRRLSNDASFAELAIHDLRATLSPGAFAPEGSLAGIVADIDGATSSWQVSERLVVDSQIDASTTDDSILVVARLVGMDFDAAVDRVWVSDGAAPQADDPAASGVIEAKFAEHWGLPPAGTVTLAGNRELDYIGLGMTPEDFFYEGPEGSILSEGELAPVYVPLAVAQDVTDKPGQVNDVVVVLPDGADRAGVAQELRTALADAGIGATVTDRDDVPAVRLLYDDIENDQRFWNVLAGLILAAAGLAGFNLISRIVESQRREIGIGMALGVARSRLAVRPLLIGLQVALLGTLAGIGVGLLVGAAMADLLRSFLPLPVWRTPFQAGMFAQAAALGVVVPILASALPVWRAVRVEPIEAIRTGHLTAKTSRLTDWTGRLPMPGSSLTSIPLRNVLRTPRRTLLTAIGIGAAITALVAVLGLLDSFTRTIDQTGASLTADAPDRVVVQLDTFHRSDSALVSSISETSAVGEVSPILRLPVAAVGRDGDPIDLLVEVADFSAAGWSPTIVESQPGTDPATVMGDAATGLVVARKAVADLGVRVGDSVGLRHPVRTDRGFTLTESEVTIIGIHDNPVRTFAYMPLADAQLFGLEGSTNALFAYPKPDATVADVQRAVFDIPGVASSQAVAGISEGFDEALAQFVGILVIAASAVLALAILIAFNATRITVDERRREHATMRAFGLPVRSVLGVIVKESVIIGLLATVLGIGAGYVFIDWMLASVADTTLPDLGVIRHVSTTTMIAAATVGIIAVALAPLFLIRRLVTMDIPDTLRVME